METLAEADLKSSLQSKSNGSLKKAADADRPISKLLQDKMNEKVNLAEKKGLDSPARRTRSAINHL